MSDFVVAGVCFPVLLVLLMVTGFAFFIADWLFARINGYAYVWHPGLFRVAAFIALFSGAGLIFIQE